MIRLTAVIELEGLAPRALTHESNARGIVLGRDATADFALPLSTISRQHARIEEVDSVYTIEDLGSTHGTSVNGRRLEPGQKRVLRHGDVIELTRAKITCAIEAEKVASAEPGEGTQAIAARAVQGILGRLGEARNGGPFLRVLTGADEGTRFALGGAVSEWTLGRSKDCECVLSDPNVSRRHAQVKKDWNGFVVHDLGSKNGVLVNDQPVQRSRRLRDQDEITVGPVRLVFVDPDADLLAALKDVPGFAVEDHHDQGTSEPPAPPGTPDAPPGLAPGESDAVLPEPPAAEDELADIDPALLASPSARLPLEWLLVGGVCVLAVGAMVALALGLA